MNTSNSPYGYTYTFPALRGTQAGREYFVAMCPLKLLPRIFLFDEASVPSELRAQRTLNTARIPEMARYLVENCGDYVLSAITASIDGEVRFQPVGTGDDSQAVGQLIVPMSSRFIINDGQHRRAAVQIALEENPALGEETIAVVFFRDNGLHRSQQLFADLNKHAVRPTQSIGILYDLRDPLSTLARAMVDAVPCFKGFTETEKTSISNRSVKLFTLSSIYQATVELLGKHKGEQVDDPERALATRFWCALCRNMPEWQQVIRKQASSAELRRDYVHAHSVALHAIGIAGRSLLEQLPTQWEDRLTVMANIDWSRSNVAVWEGRAMVGGQMSKANQSVVRTSAYIKGVLGLDLTPSEKLDLAGIDLGQRRDPKGETK